MMDGQLEASVAYAGIDTHKDTNMLGLIDALGREVGTWEFPTTPKGYQDLARMIGDTSVPVGIEGTRSYGVGVTQYLSQAGFTVYEVIRPKKEQRRRGKTDAFDAISAARNVASGCAHPVKELSEHLEDLRVVLMLREQYLDTAKRAGQRLDALLVTAPQDIREKYRSGAGTIAKIANSHQKSEYGKTIKELARVILDARKKEKALDSQLTSLVRSIAPALIGANGIGAINAAKILVAAGSNPHRMKSEAAFSMLAGTSPIPASSGRTDRHRLNRGGNRQLNCAIHSIAIARMSKDKRTKDYIAKKLSEGKTKKEAIRCLCRYIAREVYKLLTTSKQQSTAGPELAEKRRILGLTQKDIAEAIGVNYRKIGRLENESAYDSKALESYALYLDNYHLETGQEVA